MTLPTLIRLLRAVKRTDTVDLALVAVRPEYQNAGINAVLVNGIAEMLCSGRVKRCETNLNLETNTPVIAQWKYFTKRQHKRRRAFVKNIKGESSNA